MSDVLLVYDPIYLIDTLMYEQTMSKDEITKLCAAQDVLSGECSGCNYCIFGYTSELDTWSLEDASCSRFRRLGLK